MNGNGVHRRIRPPGWVSSEIRKSRGEWGLVADKRTILGRLAVKIQADLEQQYRVKSPAQRRNLIRAARALAEVERLVCFPHEVGAAIKASQLEALARRALSGHPRKVGRSA